MSFSEKLSHVDEHGKVHMVNVGDKIPTHRHAVAEARVWLPPVVFEKLKDNELHGPKGPVFHVAIIAGIMAAKKTGELIPLCHPLGLDQVSIDISVEDDELVISCTASLHGKTGVEMEALTGVSIAALTVYDMCKAMSPDIVIRQIQLMEKTGGKNDFRRKA